MIPLFTQYAHPLEKKIHRFFKNISARSNPKKTHDRLLQFMQENTIVVNLWVEKKYKNYRLLHKQNRKIFYKNANSITTLFDQFYKSQNHTQIQEKVESLYSKKNIPFPKDASEKLRCLYAITQFLQPGKYYEYIESASFSKLLQNPQKKILQGDCNQIVTLYISLYAQYFPIDDLFIKLLPDHVCLHAFGMDIEATNGSFTFYPSFERIGQITEIIAVNILDISDAREMKAKMTPKTLLESASFAYQVSGMRDIVGRNLQSSYHAMAIQMVKESRFSDALQYAKKTQKKDLCDFVLHTAAVQEAKKGNFTTAKKYATQYGNTEVKNMIFVLEGKKAFEKKDFKKARQLFEKGKHAEFVQKSYQGEFQQTLKKIPSSLKTIDDHKKYSQTYKKLLFLAKKGGLKNQEKQIQNILRQF